MPAMNIVLAQINSHVGDILGNAKHVLECARSLPDSSVVVFPELTLTGYPPEDLLLRSSMETRVSAAIQMICDASLPLTLVLGYPRHINGQRFNMAGVIHNGELVAEYAKQCLPNYQVFDEKRYFVPGNQPVVFTANGVRIGITICEDMWDGAPVEQVNAAGIDLLVNLNASPFHLGKQATREALVSSRAKQIGAPVAFVNWVGGQDELVFDGGSIAVNRDGELVARAPAFETALLALQYDLDTKDFVQGEGEQNIAPEAPALETIYKALVLGVRDYINKNGFKGAVLGLSGGIDSALTLAIAVDAIGADRVEAVMMPFRYTSDMSKSDAEEEARLLGVEYRSISIEPIYEAFVESLSSAFANTQKDTTEENIQARSRGVLLMALSNKLGYLVLTTGNKSEMAVGYATLYGDMAGGLDVLKDVPKTTVFELAKYRNTLGYVIPENVITRPPSAELAPDQKDEDSLPPYDVLDKILHLYIEKDFSHKAIVEQGFDEEQVRQVIRLVDLNEYKRRQAPIGIRISERAFGRDRRYPITNGWPIGD